MKRMLALVLALVMVIGMMPAISVNAQTTDRVADLVANMSLKDKVTQMLMVDFRDWGVAGASATDFTVMNDEVRQIIEDYNFGSIILFADNIKETEQSYNLTMAMQEAATKDGGIALIICADQEGGSVYRLGSGTALPGNMALGATYATNGTKYAYEAGKIIGSELDAVGINGNLAPVVDVNNNANNPVIGLRSYSDDANIVGELASASIAGMAEYNVIGTAKHFPGHGDTATDSHYGLPIVDKSLEVLKDVELKPYEVAIDQGIEMIMTAHILYPQLESDKIVSNKTGEAESLPATMSDDILTGLLKGDMGFEGVVVTDAMNMAGISGKWDQVQSCVIAIQAGVDLICMPCTLSSTSSLANLDKIINGLIAAVEDGTIPMERVNDAVTRILTVKENRGILDYDPAEHTLEKANAVVGSAANREMERELSAAAVTVIKNKNNTLPLQLTENSKVLMLVPYDNERSQMLMAWNRAKEAGLIPEGAEVDYFRFNSTTINSTLQTKLDWADTYIINSEISSTSRFTSNHWLYAMPTKLCDYAAENGKTAIISSVDKPYDVQMYANADAIVAAYGCKGSSVDPTEALIGGATGSAAAYGPNIIAAVEVILGTFEAQGKLPVNIPVFDFDAKEYSDVIAYKRGYGLCTSHIFVDGVCTICCTPESPSQQLTGLTGTASSVDTSEPAHNKDVVNAFDGDTNTFWATVPGTLADAYLIADLGGERTINQVNYTKRYDSGAIWNCTGNLLDYIIEISTDGETWTQVAAGATVDGTTEITFAPVQAAYVRLTATKSYHWDPPQANTVMTAAEFEVYEITEKSHTPAEAVVENEKAATCTETGSYDTVVYCSVCGEELSRETTTIEALGHTEEIIPGTEATCTEAGLTEGKKCTVCGEILAAQEEIPALGHTFGEWTVTTEPTCTEAGVETRTCACGATETRAVEALGHEYVDGVCIRCGEADPNAVTVIAEGWSGYTTWVLTSDGTITFTSSGETLPNGESNLKNYWKVDGVLTLPWGEYAEQITKVVINEGIHDIGQMAFYELPNLVEVVLPESAVEIRGYAFKNCPNLTTINLEVVEFIREGAFYGCSALEGIELTEGTVVEDWAFSKTPFASYNP